MGRSHGKQDDKERRLRQDGTLNSSADRVSDPLFLDHEFFDPRDVVQVKYEMLRRAQREGQTVTAVTAAFGVSRPTYYEASRAFEDSGLCGLVPRKRGPRGAHKLTKAVVDFVLEQLAERSDAGAPELARRVRDRFGVQVHPRSVERAIARRKRGGK